MLGSRWIAPLRRLGPVLATIFVLGGAAPALASAADRYVATTGSDAANNCLTQATPCLTVQHAVLQSGNGDDVNVAAGTYPESVTVGVSVEIDGPFGGTAGSDPSRGGAGEARIVGVGRHPAITIEADGVGIQGMALGPATGPPAAGTTGVHLDDFSTTTAIVDTLIENVARGVDLKDASFPIMVFSAVHGASDAAVVLEHVTVRSSPTTSSPTATATASASPRASPRRPASRSTTTTSSTSAAEGSSSSPGPRRR